MQCLLPHQPGTSASSPPSPSTASPSHLIPDSSSVLGTAQGHSALPALHPAQVCGCARDGPLVTLRVLPVFAPLLSAQVLLSAHFAVLADAPNC